jgi:hypothetical protein
MDVFQPSDLDFGIVFGNKNNLSRQNVHWFTDQISYRMKQLRDFMIERFEDFFPNLLRPKHMIQSALMDYFEEMKIIANATEKLPFLKGIECLGIGNVYSLNEWISGYKHNTERPDLSIFFKNEDESIINTERGIKTIDDKWVCYSVNKSSLFVSTNKSLYFPTDRALNNFQHFDLVRMKLSFKLYTGENSLRINDHTKPTTQYIGAEVIDISIQHNDVQQPLFDRLKAQTEQNYVTYSIHTTKNETYNIHSYSIHGLIYDIASILFLDAAAPWDDNKYEKRLRRLMALLLCEALIERSHGFDKDKLNMIMKSLEDIPAEETVPIEKNTIWSFIIKRFQNVYAKYKIAEEITRFREITTNLVKVNCSLIDLNEKKQKDIYSRVVVGVK